MKNNKKRFTLIELLFSISIMSVIIIGIWWVLIKMSQNFYESNYHINTYKEIIEIQNDIMKDSYSSGYILSGSTYKSLLLENTYNYWWILIWVFDKNMDFIDYKITSDNDIIWYNNLWYFYISETVLNDIKNTHANIINYDFNKWKIFSNINIADFEIMEYDDNIFQLKIEIFKNIRKYIWKNRSEIQINNDDKLKTNLFF